MIFRTGAKTAIFFLAGRFEKIYKTRGERTMIKRINNVLEFLETSANNFPDKIAFADEGNSVTYAELTAKAKRMAVGISKKTVSRSPVAVLGGKKIETVIAFFACVYAGCFMYRLTPCIPYTD